MQDNTFASDAFFWQHVDVHQPVALCPKINYKHTCDTHYLSITSKIFEDCSFIFLPIHRLSTYISTRPQQVLPLQMTGGRVSAYSCVVKYKFRLLEVDKELHLSMSSLIGTYYGLTTVQWNDCSVFIIQLTPQNSTLVTVN